jgi:hypothetical protein
MCPIQVTEKQATTWPQLRDQLASYNDLSTGLNQQWAFRGMANKAWSLRTSLERLNVNYLVVDAENYLLTTFQRRAHHFVRDCPPLNDYLEWLALMQHHGTPTRLLDCTRSAYVALFFALKDNIDSTVEPAVWAINLDSLKNTAIGLFTQLNPDPLSSQNADPALSLGKPAVFKAAFMGEHESTSRAAALCVAPIQPFRMNERLTIQQGLFLCPASVSVGFEENLAAMNLSDATIMKHVFPANLRMTILAELNKMNINRASLFPGIDGFAQSLGLNIEIATSMGKIKQEIKRLDAYSEYGF